MNEDIFEEIEEDELEDIAPERELYEHFRFVVDKGQTLVRIDK